MTEAWLRDSNYVVVLSVPDVHSLVAHYDRLPTSSAKALVLEPDLGDVVTAFAVLGNDAGRALANRPLAGKDLAMS